MNKLFAIFTLSSISFHSFGTSATAVPSLDSSAVSSLENVKKNSHEADLEITNLINSNTPLSFIQRKAIFDFLNRLSGDEYVKLLHKTIDLFHKNPDLPEGKIELVLFPDLLAIPDIVGNKDLFIVFNYKNKNIQSLKNKILGSEKISESLKRKISLYINYQEKSKSYDTVGFGQGIVPEILPPSEWDVSFLNNPSSLKSQEEAISSFSLKLKNIVNLLNNSHHFTEDEMKQISSSVPQMLLELKNLIRYTPPSDLNETIHLEKKFYLETFPLIQKLQTVLFEMQERKSDNQLSNTIRQHFSSIGTSHDSYLIDYAICQELLKRQTEENSDPQAFQSE